MFILKNKSIYFCIASAVLLGALYLVFPNESRGFFGQTRVLAQRQTAIEVRNVESPDAPQACSLSGTLGTAPAGGTTGGLSNRLQRNGLANGSTCSSSVYPGLFATAGSFAYNAHTIANTSSSPQCITFTLTTTADLQIAAFKAPFVAADIATASRHLGDSGASSGGVGISTFQTIIPANTNIALVVFSPSSGTGVGSTYSLTVTSTFNGTGTICGFGTGTKNYTGAVVPIPDSVSAGVNISLPVSGIGRIRDLDFDFLTGGLCDATPGNVNAAVDHTFIGDLRFILTSPKGTTATFQSGRGGSRENICTTRLDDEFNGSLLSSISNTTGLFQSGTFQPEDTGRMNRFRGENADGIWTLNVSDLSPIDTGSIRRFGLLFTANLFPSNDFNNSGTSDISIYRPSNGEWYWLTPSGVRGAAFGGAGDRPVPGDYTGDGQTDLAFFRPSTGQWFVIRSVDSSFYAFPFGASGDIPTPGDFDGDGKTDAAVFRPSNGVWYINKSDGSGVTIQPFGVAGDIPVVENYDGDNKDDIAIYRPSNGEWYTLRSSTGLVRGAAFGGIGDLPVQGDYTGDGKADFAFWRPSDGNWFVLRSEDSSFFAAPFGAAGDKPVPGDYDGDGKNDQAVFRPSNGVWYINRSDGIGITIQPFGVSSDIPVAAYYLP
jgi:hypothetical protein